jgi:hypothetical protein
MLEKDNNKYLYNIAFTNNIERIYNLFKMFNDLLTLSND